MRYEYRRVKCPLCGKLVERNFERRKLNLKGSPFRTCPYCRGMYFDAEYKEQALELINKLNETITFGEVVCLICGHILAACCLYILISGINSGNFSWLALFINIIVVGSILLCDIGLILRAIDGRHRNENIQNTVDYLEGRGDARPLTLIESLNRLSNKEYLDALHTHGVEIPQYFYDRIGEEK